MRYRLVNVGRGKYTGEVDVRSFGELLKAVRRHLRSREVQIDDEGVVLVGGMRRVGQVEPVGDVARMQFRKWFEDEVP